MHSSKKSLVAAFTMSYNERVFLPIWRSYYGRELGYDNLFVIDHGSSDGSTGLFDSDHKKFIPRTKFDEFDRSEIVSNYFEYLLNYYEYVIFSDTDELLLPHPDFAGGIVDLIQARGASALRAYGLELVQINDTESAIDFTKPILAQRSIAQVNPKYAKTLIGNVPLKWGPGFHRCSVRVAPDPELFLLHLKKMDSAIARAGQERLFNIEWSDRSLEARHGRQFRLTPDAYVGRYFRISSRAIFQDGSEVPNIEAARASLFGTKGMFVQIPDRWSSRLLPPYGVPPAA